MQDQSIQKQFKPWFVYMILDTDQHLYTGITTNMARRWHEHTSGKAGARYFRGRQPALLCFLEEQVDRSHASKRECAIKRLHRRDKVALLHHTSSNTHSLITRFKWSEIPCLEDLSFLQDKL